MLWFFWPRDATPDIAHRLANRIGRCAMMHAVIFLAKRYNTIYRISTGESNRSMCDDACCDFLAKRYNTRYRTSTGDSVANRIGRWAMMHVVIFLAKRYKARYRTSTGESNWNSSDQKLCDFRLRYWILNQKSKFNVWQSLVWNDVVLVYYFTTFKSDDVRWCILQQSATSPFFSTISISTKV